MKIEFNRTRCEGREAAIIDAIIGTHLFARQGLMITAGNFTGRKPDLRPAFEATVEFMTDHFPDLAFEILEDA